ncbi:hypothetical protein ACE6H2_004738 [Prunus campanulata]
MEKMFAVQVSPTQNTRSLPPSSVSVTRSQDSQQNLGFSGKEQSISDQIFHSRLIIQSKSHV